MEAYYPPILRRYMAEERDAGNAYTDATTRIAAGICGACQKTSEAVKGAEPLNRKERAQYNEQVKPVEQTALKEWAFSNQCWISESQFVAQYGERQIGEGSEQRVYLKPDGKTVVKVNLGFFHGNWLEYFNRLLCHAFLFPATGYTTKGFTEEQGQFGVITEQPYFRLDAGASRAVVEPYLSAHGFIRVKNEDYFNRTTSIKLEDLHDENVFVGEQDSILFIDPVIYCETPDMNLSGSMVFRFPFE